MTLPNAIEFDALDSRITVMQVFAYLGIQPTSSQSWAVGNRVAAMYANEFGEQPPKDNRPKTSGGGTHCFALYPRTWQERIARVINEVVDAEAAQQDLFKMELAA
jgi:hypothetical protein